MVESAISRQLAQQLNDIQREFEQLGDAWLAEPAASEPLHDFRVAWRRLRAVLDLMRQAPALAPAANAAKEAMAPLMRSSSTTRDFDVLLPQVQQWSQQSQELAPLGEVIIERRRECAGFFGAQWRQRQVLLASALQTLRQQLPAVTLPESLYEHGLERCEKRARHAAQRCADKADAPSWHRLRVRCKRWRYTLELAGIAGGKRLRRLQRLQRQLGDAQDAAAAITLLSQLASPVLPPACLLAMGRQQCRLEQQRTAALERAQRKLGKLLHT
jgi:CHAD domain-containing protein